MGAAGSIEQPLYWRASPADAGKTRRAFGHLLRGGTACSSGATSPGADSSVADSSSGWSSAPPLDSATSSDDGWLAELYADTDAPFTVRVGEAQLSSSGIGSHFRRYLSPDKHCLRDAIHRHRPVPPQPRAASDCGRQHHRLIQRPPCSLLCAPLSASYLCQQALPPRCRLCEAAHCLCGSVQVSTIAWCSRALAAIAFVGGTQQLTAPCRRYAIAFAMPSAAHSDS